MKLAALLLAAAPLFATPCVVTLFPDEQPVDLSCPQIGAPLTPFPGSTYFVSWEDLPVQFSRDFNEVESLVSFTATEATWTFLGNDGALLDTLLVNGVPLYTGFTLPGYSVTVPISVPTLHAHGIGYDATYAIGSGNSYVVCLTPDKCGPNAVPEPGSWTLIAAGLLTIALVNLGLYLKALPSIKQRRRARIIQRVREQSSDPLWRHICDEQEALR